MQATWELLDVNGDGSISREELCLALESCGIKLARWELRNMMDEADANGDGVIDRQEFEACYHSMHWNRVNGLAKLLEEIKVTWALFDKDGDGSITHDELRQVFSKLNLDLSPEAVEEMIRSADVDMDGEINYSEFVTAWHSPQWKEARALGMAHRGMESFTAAQDEMYAELMEEERQQQAEEGEARARVGGEELSKMVMMKRRALRRHPAVKVAIDKFWHALSALKVDGEFIPKEVYLTYHVKIARAFDGTDDAALKNRIEREARDAERRAEAEADWISDCRKARLSDVTGAGDGMDRIGYSVFYDSMFELADVEYGRDRESEGSFVPHRLSVPFVPRVIA